MLEEPKAKDKAKEPKAKDTLKDTPKDTPKVSKALGNLYKAIKEVDILVYK